MADILPRVAKDIVPMSGECLPSVLKTDMLCKWQWIAVYKMGRVAKYWPQSREADKRGLHNQEFETVLPTPK
jgi:hypothetical protein